MIYPIDEVDLRTNTQSRKLNYLTRNSGDEIKFKR